jgi:hypothetical protein
MGIFCWWRHSSDFLKFRRFGWLRAHTWGMSSMDGFTDYNACPFLVPDELGLL